MSKADRFGQTFMRY